LLKANLKQLRLPTMGAECEKLAREAAAAGESYEQYLLRLTELEVAARATNALQARIKQAGFPMHKDFDTFDFTAAPWLNKLKLLELARGQWIDECSNVCLLGSVGTGKTHVAIALGLAACRQGRRVRSSRPRRWSIAWKRRRSYTSSIASWPSWTVPTCWSAMNWGICRSAARAPSCCSKCSPIGMSVRAC
jgi:DNA replication protein DnaC